jgi:O-antigen ligase
VKLQAGESTYTELGVETGLLGGLLWVAWGVALLAALAAVARRGGEPRWLTAGVAAALAAVLALALQTDVVGDPWLAYVLWALAGICLTRARGATVQA